MASRKPENQMTDGEVIASPSKAVGYKWPAWFTVEQMRRQLTHEEAAWG